MTRRPSFLLLGLIVSCVTCVRARAAEPGDAQQVFGKSNLVAWCIVPFDASKRGPAQRAEMVKDLGLTKVAYDWRSEHVDSFEEEIEQYKKHGIEFFAFWSWHDAIEPLIRKHSIRPQIWMTLPSPEQTTQAAKVQAAANELLPMVEKTRKLGLKLGLYNHGGWGGQPKNMVAVCKYLRKHHRGDHVGIVYNFHHGHEHVANFQRSLATILPYLLCLNLNGMADPATVDGNTNKIVPIGKGLHEQAMIREIIRQGYAGPIGVLDHRNEMDSQEALSLNLNGLTALIEELD